MILAGRARSPCTDGPSVFNPIHEDDIVAQLPALLDAASVPATIVNWGGDELVSIEEWCAYLADLIGRGGKFAPTTEHIRASRSTSRACTRSPAPRTSRGGTGSAACSSPAGRTCSPTDADDLRPRDRPDRPDRRWSPARPGASGRPPPGAWPPWAPRSSSPTASRPRPRPRRWPPRSPRPAGRAHVHALRRRRDRVDRRPLRLDRRPTGPGGLDILVANAAATSLKPLLEQAPHNVERTFAISVTGFLHAVQRAVPLMEARGGGRIVAVSGHRHRVLGPGPRPPGRGQGGHGDAGHAT